uniref:UPAR/Ly6 domain-containing protein n=1 Tax=Cyprinodon variegatus TaxID=28743 RepID=A0A3Q2CF14_CYPVA
MIFYQTGFLSRLMSAMPGKVNSLLCNFCPLQHKNKSCTNMTSECLPHQHCSSSRGRYGSVHVLSSQGCLDAKLCDSHEMISYRGVEYNISHTCCCRDGCAFTVGTRHGGCITSPASILTLIRGGFRKSGALGKNRHGAL